MIPHAKLESAGCYLMQLAMRKFDVKKNCSPTKDLMGVDYQNFKILLSRHGGFKK
jgi:hypothetical protein